MILGPQMSDISVDNQRANFNTGPYGARLKIKILKNDFLHAREDQIIGPEPNFNEPRSSNGKD